MAFVHREVNWGAHVNGASHRCRPATDAPDLKRNGEPVTLEISVDLAEARGLTVVAVGADEELRSALKEILPKEGIVFADSPEQVLSQPTPNNCAVLVVEQTLSRSIFERLKSHLNPSAHTLVTIMTGSGDNSSTLVSRLSAGHIDRFIVKPFRLGPTRSALRSALQQHRSLIQCARVEKTQQADASASEPTVIESAANHKTDSRGRSASGGAQSVAVQAVVSSPSKERRNRNANDIALPVNAAAREQVHEARTLEYSFGAAARRFSSVHWSVAFVASIATIVFAVIFFVGKNTQTSVTTVSGEKVIAGHLAAAHRAFDLGSYVDPDGLSAAYFYGEVLAIDPTNVEARRGLDAVSDRLMEAAKQLIAADDLLRAQSMLDNVRRLQPKHAELPAVSTALSSAREAERATLQAARSGNKDTVTPTETPTAQVVPSIPRVFAKTASVVAPNVRPRIESRVATVAQGNSIVAGSGNAISSQSIEERRLPEPIKPASKSEALTIDSSGRSLSQVTPEASLDVESRVATSLSLKMPSMQNATDDPVSIIKASRLAGALTNAANHEPALIKYVKPAYPAKERLSGIEGWLDVHFLVTSDGRVIKPYVGQRSVGSTLRRAALDAVAQWRYSPAPTPDTPDRPMTVRVQFKLD